MTYKEFRKWLYENWDAIYDKFEKSWAKSRIVPESFVDIKDLSIGTPNKFNVVTDKDTLYVLPTEPKPIKICFVGDSLGEADYKDIKDITDKV